MKHCNRKLLVHTTFDLLVLCVQDSLEKSQLKARKRKTDCREYSIQYRRDHLGLAKSETSSLDVRSTPNCESASRSRSSRGLCTEAARSTTSSISISRYLSRLLAEAAWAPRIGGHGGGGDSQEPSDARMWRRSDANSHTKRRALTTRKSGGGIEKRQHWSLVGAASAASCRCRWRARSAYSENAQGNGSVESWSSTTKAAGGEDIPSDARNWVTGPPADVEQTRMTW